MSTNANMQREMCLRGPGGQGKMKQRERGELRPAETLVTASQSAAKVMILMMMSQPGLFIEITTLRPTQF